MRALQNIVGLIRALGLEQTLLVDPAAMATKDQSADTEFLKQICAGLAKGSAHVHALTQLLILPTLIGINQTL